MGWVERHRYFVWSHRNIHGFQFFYYNLQNVLESLFNVEVGTEYLLLEKKKIYFMGISVLPTCL